MVNFRIVFGKSVFKSHFNMTEQYLSENLLIESSETTYILNHNNEKFILIGNLVGYRDINGIINSVNDLLQIIDIIKNPNRLDELEGRFVIFRISESSNVEIWTDNFGRLEVYYQFLDDTFILCSSLEFFQTNLTRYKLDNVGVAHSLTVYGSRPAKKHTLYSDVKRLGTYEGIKISNNNVEILNRDVKLRNAQNYDESKLHEYSDIFLEAIRSRASVNGNIVYLSSGWDSTSILAALVHLFGNKKTRCVIGRMQYSDRSGVINQFEIDRAISIARYFDVKLDIVEFDYRKNAEKVLIELKGLFKSQNFANMTGFNHWLLAEEIAKTSNGDEVVFAGEMSDGAHNLGFSQYATIFHPSSFDFREYSDKMLSYLHGPTFYNEVLKGSENIDPVWNLFKNLNRNVVIDDICKDKIDINKQFLSSFFLRSGRLPFFSIKNSNLLSSLGQKSYLDISEKCYLNNFAESLTEENLYATYLHLYNTFHWQGSTVSTIEYTADYHGFKCALPFHDKGLIDFLSSMPENWGRGLDLNNTKYPLKWMLKNKIDYPMHLQTGPHSYTYDVIPNFSLLGEILFASSFKPLLIDSLNNGNFINQLDKTFINMNYVDHLILEYTKGVELFSKEREDLGVLAMHSLIGLY